MTHSLAQRSLVETLATGFLAYSASRAGNADINALDQCLLIGLVLASLIHLCGRTSGAHLNQDQMQAVMRQVMTGEATSAQIAGLLITLKMNLD